MEIKFRWLLAGLLLFMTVAVDFTSKFMSVLSDGLFIAGVCIALWPMIKQKP